MSGKHSTEIGVFCFGKNQSSHIGFKVLFGATMSIDDFLSGKGSRSHFAHMNPTWALVDLQSLEKSFSWVSSFFFFFFSSFPKHDHMRLIINLWQFLNELLISVQRKVQLQEHQKISCQGSLLSRPYILLRSHSTAFFLEKSWCQTGICSM